jgi:ubiquinone/menaquinone biosynthesis C-methylase UbiE
MLDDYLDAMAVGEASTVLDMGCGTGLVARALARRVGFSGQVTGVDLSPHLVAAAEQLARDEGLSGHTSFRTGDVHKLDFAPATFDAVIAHTLLSHVDNVAGVLAELARVLRPGGLLGIFDGDFASLTFGYADPLQGQLHDEALISAVWTNPRVMRQMPRLLRLAGLEPVNSFAYVLAEVGTADFWASAIEAYRRLIPQAGVMSVAEADDWARALMADSDAGDFFGSCNFFAYVARRP